MADLNGRYFYRLERKDYGLWDEFSTYSYLSAALQAKREDWEYNKKFYDEEYEYRIIEYRTVYQG